MPPIVIHVVSSLRPGGLERLVVDWTIERDGRWPGRTFVACLDAPGEWAASLGERVVCLNADRARFPWDRRAAARLTEYISRLAGGRRTVLHAHNPAAWQYAVLAGSMGGAAVVYTQHGPNPHCRRWQDRLRYRFLAPRTHAIVAVARNVADAMAKHQGIRSATIRLIPNGIICRHPQERKRPRPEDVMVIGFVGRLSHEKGTERLLRAFSALAGQSCAWPGKKTWALWLIGDGPSRCDLEQAVSLLPQRVRENVMIAGYRDDIPECLQGMDLFILPSLAEGCSVALLEAMAAGVPVMATRVGDNEEILDHGKVGFLLADDEKKWPEQIVAVCSQHDRVVGMARQALGWVTEHYSVERVLSDYEAVYDEVAHTVQPVSNAL